MPITYYRGRKPISLTDHQPLHSRDKSRPLIRSSEQGRRQSTNAPDDAKWELVNLDLPYVLPDGTILFWTGLVSLCNPKPTDDK